MGGTEADPRYAFVVEWYDPAASLMRQYQLIYYGADGTLEMYDLKNRRTFLKRCDYPGIAMKDLFKGGIVTVYSRQLKIVDYADSFTAGTFEKSVQMSCATIKSSAMGSMGRILDAISSQGFSFTEMALTKGGLVFSATGATPLSQLLTDINSSLGAESVVAAGADALSVPKAAVTEVESSSLLLVRPHAVKAGALGRILDQVLGSGFRVLNLKLVQLTRPNSQEFLEVYKGVVPECIDWVEELCSGKCVAMQVVHASKPDATVLAVRELCGAHDPEIASHLHPHSLRAQYGESKVKNAVHCTDLPEDGPLEVDYFFTLL